MHDVRFWAVSVGWVVFYVLAWILALPAFMSWLTGASGVLYDQPLAWLIALVCAVLVTAAQRAPLRRSRRRSHDGS